MKLEMMRANPEVCFEELHGQEATHAMQQLAEHLMPMMTSETSQPHGSGGADPSEAVVYRIKPREMTGRFEKR
jgi:nitroimidazol reductase NimA-like FMN-containing flavoprotein (pyridoxamine 5'-phosphate oxidase superfamily)